MADRGPHENLIDGWLFCARAGPRSTRAGLPRGSDRPAPPHSYGPGAAAQQARHDYGECSSLSVGCPAQRERRKRRFRRERGSCPRPPSAVSCFSPSPSTLALAASSTPRSARRRTHGRANRADTGSSYAQQESLGVAASIWSRVSPPAGHRHRRLPAPTLSRFRPPVCSPADRLPGRLTASAPQRGAVQHTAEREALALGPLDRFGVVHLDFSPPFGRAAFEPCRRPLLLRRAIVLRPGQEVVAAPAPTAGLPAAATRARQPSLVA